MIDSMNWGPRVRGTLFLLVLGLLAYLFLDYNGSINDKLYLLLGLFAAVILAAVVLEINPLKPFSSPDDKDSRN